MKERVSLLHGSQPIIIVSPYAADEAFMGVIAEEMAKRLNAYALINNGFKKSDDVNVLQDQANLDRIEHVYEDVVKEEFLDPLMSAKRRLMKKHLQVFVFYLYGFDSEVEEKTGNDIDIILGYGQAVVSNSYLCPVWWISKFIDSWDSHSWTSGDVYCGKPGGPFTARSIHRLPQIFRKVSPDPDVQSLQIFVSDKFRHSHPDAAFCGVLLANIIEEIVKSDYFDEDVDRYYV
jgi:hypothetical protein